MVKTVPVALFDKEGILEKIFEEVRKGEPMIVVDGNEKLCVMISLKRYVALVRESEGL